jgi:hypothetical protein
MTECRHNEILIYPRPLRRLFRRTPAWVCVRCDRIRPRTPGIWNPHHDPEHTIRIDR